MTSNPLNKLQTHCDCKRLSAVPACHWPEILSALIDANSAIIDMNISPRLHWFKGHFPEQPVLPGVVQTHWACLLAPAVFDLANEFTAMNRLKFKEPLLPGQTVSLSLAHDAIRNRINYRYHNDDAVFSTGTIHFGKSTV